MIVVNAKDLTPSIPCRLLEDNEYYFALKDFDGNILLKINDGLIQSAIMQYWKMAYGEGVSFGLNKVGKYKECELVFEVHND